MRGWRSCIRGCKWGEVKVESGRWLIRYRSHMVLIVVIETQKYMVGYPSLVRDYN